MIFVSYMYFIFNKSDIIKYMNKQTIIVFIIILYIFVRSFFIEPNSLVVTKYKINEPRLNGSKIVFLSDLDIKKRDYKRLAKIIDLVNKQMPDIVLLGGDYIKENSVKNAMNVDMLASKLSLINVPMYAILGDEDWKAGADEIKTAFWNNQIAVLENANKRIMLNRRYVDIIGVSDLHSKPLEIEKAFRRTALPRIVITHNPDIYYNIMDDVTLILAGHTHGGQFILPFTPPLFVPSKFGAQFAGGLVQPNSNKMIISRGIGTTGLPLRLNCKPEIVVIEFVK